MEDEGENKSDHSLEPNTESAEVVIDITEIVDPIDIESPTVVVDPKDILGPIVRLDPTEIVGPIGPMSCVNSTDTNKDENSISIDIDEGTHDDLKLTVGYGLVENTKARDKNTNIFTGKQGNIYRTEKVWVFQQVTKPSAEGEPLQYQGEPLQYQSNRRNKFVILVLILCFFMLLVTFAFTFFCYITPPMIKFLRSGFGALILILCLFVTCIISYIFCLSNCGRVIPCNYILIFITNVCYSYLTAYFATKYGPYIVMAALITTMFVILLCLVLALTNFDFTRTILIVTVAIMAACVALCLTIILTVVLGVKLSIARMIFLIVMSVLHSVMLVIEFQMILGGKTVEIGEDDYAYAAFLIYTSIIHIFINFMRIGGGD